MIFNERSVHVLDCRGLNFLLARVLTCLDHLLILVLTHQGGLAQVLEVAILVPEWMLAAAVLEARRLVQDALVSLALFWPEIFRNRLQERLLAFVEVWRVGVWRIVVKQHVIFVLNARLLQQHCIVRLRLVRVEILEVVQLVLLEGCHK